MVIFFIIGILVGALTVLFALQNVETTTVTFLMWDITGSLALIIILAVLAGLIMSTLFALPGMIKNHFQIITLKKQVKKLEDDLASSKNQKDSAAASQADTNIIA